MMKLQPKTSKDYYCDELYEHPARLPHQQMNAKLFTDMAKTKPRGAESHINRFTERHLIESLGVESTRSDKSVMFYNMLNQGNKRGKETQVLALDCERILTDEGERLARVSIVNFYGNIVFDTLVKPCKYHSDKVKVIDYREWCTGIKAMDLEQAPAFCNIEPIIKKIVRGKTIVGHSLENDFLMLAVDPEALKVQVRDISELSIFQLKIDRDSHSPLRETKKLEVVTKNSSASSKSSNEKPIPPNCRIRKRKLKDLAQEFLNAKI